MGSFSKAQDWLKQLASENQFFRKGVPPSLDVVNLILDTLTRPDRSFEYRVIVAGTAGKGICCRLTEQTLLGEGKTVCTLVSPHLQSITERIRINGHLISREEFGRVILEVKVISKKISTKPTYYEAIVMAGILAGAQAGCEILVAEVGLGGRLDAVNAIEGKRIAAVTFIGDDHREILGGTLDAIAREKSGVFTNNSVLNLSYEKKYKQILDAQSSIPINYVKGITNKLNKKLVRNICEKILGRSDFVMNKLQIPCRWEKVAPNITLDGAHSKPRFEFIIPNLKKITGKKVGVFAMAKNHDPKNFKIILDYFDEVIWTEVSEGRDFWKAKELKKIFERGTIETNPIQAFKKATESNSNIIVLGSFYLSGIIRNLFYPTELVIKQQTEFPKRAIDESN